MGVLGKRPAEVAGIDADPIKKTNIGVEAVADSSNAAINKPLRQRCDSVNSIAPHTPCSSQAEGAINAEVISTTPAGEKGTLSYRVFFEHAKQGEISPWHHIPLFASDDHFNFVCEIPKWTRAKFEVATGEASNPIKQDEKKGVLREYKWGDMMFNYGMFPQTWEDPNVICEATGYKGDDDPLDVIEVGTRQMKTGEVSVVKVLGVLAMIDDGETDWKVLTIRTDDAMASKLNDVEDLEREMPGAVSALREWLRVYKVPEGKPMNEFALEEKCMPKDYAVKVIVETHEAWKAKYGAEAEAEE